MRICSTQYLHSQKKYDDADEGDDDVTLDNLKKNLTIYSFKNLRKLVAMLIDSLSELITEIDCLNNSLDIFQDETSFW